MVLSPVLGILTFLHPTDAPGRTAAAPTSLATGTLPPSVSSMLAPAIAHDRPRTLTSL